MEEEKVSFTIRIPASLARQIDARARILERSKNFIVTDMLMRAIDEGVERDLNLIRATTDRRA